MARARKTVNATSLNNYCNRSFIFISTTKKILIMILQIEIIALMTEKLVDVKLSENKILRGTDFNKSTCRLEHL